MADLDRQLSISVQASADDAKKAIDGLISSLKSLDQSLNLGNLKSFTTQLKDIADAAKGLSGIGKDINSIATASSKLASLTGFKTLNDQMDETRTAAKNLVADLNKTFHFDAAKDGQRNIQELEQYIVSLMKNANRTGDTGVFSKNAGFNAEMLKNMSVTIRDLDSEYADLVKWAKQTNLYVDESTKSWLKNAGVMREVRSAFKSVTSDSAKGSSIHELADDLKRFGIIADDARPADKIQEIVRTIKTYKSVLDSAVVQGKKQVSEGLVSDEYFTQAGHRLAESVRKSFDSIYGQEGKKDIFGSIVPSLLAIENIDLPDFSNIAVLADALSKLQSIDSKKIQEIAAAVNLFRGDASGINTSGLDSLSATASSMAESAPNVEKMSDAIVRVKEDIAGTSGEIIDNAGIKEATQNVHELANGIKECGSAAEETKAHKIDNIVNPEQMSLVDDALNGAVDVIDKAGVAAEETGNKAKNASDKAKDGSVDLLANLVALSHEVTKVAAAFDKWGDTGIKALKLAFKPMGVLMDDFREKASRIQDAFGHMRKNVEKHLTKLSQFWRRTMKTFTFMLVRKAITAIIGEVKDAVNSLATWSNTFGTEFNDSISEITANASYLARLLVGALEPVINYIVPLLNMLTSAIANAMHWLAEFFAAITGQSYFMVAKKNVGNYAESLNKASKAQKNLTMGIDELNILSENNSGSGSGGGIGGLGDWDTEPVSDKMRGFAEDIKRILDRLFDPLKKAWDRAGLYVTNGFKYMVGELAKLAKQIGLDFLEVWNQPETIRMLTEVLAIIGDIELTIGNLAKRFNEAWTEGGKGKKIFEGIRDILAILIGHVRNVTFYMTKWSNSLNFNPLLEKTVELLQKMKPLAEFIGGLFQDIMKNVVLEYIKFLIEDGIPHLLETIGEILDAFDFSKLREQFVPIEKAFEKVLENVDKGIVNAIGNFGKAVGEFTQSEDFQKFLDTIVWFLNQITEARVQKVFDVLGGAILKVSKALIDFVSSDDFKDFLEMILKWFDDTDTDKLSDGLINIAKAILAFKFTAFVGKGVSGFASFLSVLASAKSAIGILTGLGTAGGAAGAGAGAAAGGFGAFAAAIAPVAAVIAGVVTVVYSLVKSFGGIKGVVEEVSKHFGLVTGVLKKVAEALKLNEFIDRLKKSFDDLKEALGAQKGLWQAIMYVLDGVAIVIGSVLIPVVEVICHLLSSLIEICAGVIEGIGGVFNVIMGFINGDSQQISEGWSQIFDGMEKTVDGFLDFFLGEDTPIRHIVDYVIENFGTIKDETEKKWKEIKENIVAPIKEAYEKVAEKLSKFKENAEKKWDEIDKKAKDSWQGIKNNIINPIKETYEKAVEKFTKLKEDAEQKWNEIKNKAEELWLLIKEKIINPIVEAYNKVVEKLTFLKDKAVEIWTNVKTEAERLWGLIKENIINPIIKAYDDVVLKLTNLKDEAIGIWETVKTEAERIWLIIYDNIFKPIKQAYDDVVGKLTDLKRDALEAWNAFVDGVKDSAIGKFFSDLAGDVKDLIDGFVKIKDDPLQAWNDFVKGIEDSTIVKFIGGLVDKVQDLIQGFKDLKGVADKTKESTDKVNTPQTQAENHFNGGFVGTYATGGYPSRGTLFWAGEYGLPEMLGTVGGKTAVASSAEITGIRESVMESSIAEQNMMGQMINLLQTIAAKDLSVNMDSRELLSSLNDRARRNGYNFRAATT